MAVTSEASDTRYRLPRGAVPSRYDMVLEPDLVSATFAGSEDVVLEVREPLHELILNAADLDIDAGWVVSSEGERVEVLEVRTDDETERAALRLGRRLDPGTWTLHAEFRGTLNDRMRGFYRSTYTDDEGVQRAIATTQFESTDARRAFPCWDEPDLKAVFGVTLIVPDGLLAISNEVEVDREKLGDGRVRVRFADTMPMSTYLAAFVVGPLEATDPVDVDGIPLRIVHVPGKGDLAAFALESGAFALRFFADYYGIPYPGGKLDMVALPDFAQGAMENLGCITYREVALLADADRATQPELQGIADTVAHEIAHMWFGDLVTMRWWNGIWLNEAFATFMELVCVDAFRPEWDRWALHARSRSVAFDIDALGATRPIEYPVHSPNDANGMFDTLTYIKGASVLRMLEQYLTPEGFREGIRRYLVRHTHGNTETSDLWDALEDATGEPVRAIMDSWIWQGGFPLVSATVRDGGVYLSQQRFRFDGETDGTRWLAPLLVRHGAEADAPVEPVLVQPEGASIAHPHGAPAVVNAGGHGFVRVRYDAALRERLADSLGLLSPIERYQLVDDTWASTLLGASTAAEYCTLARAFGDETDLPVWQALLLGLGWCDRALDGTPRERFRAFVRELVRPALDRLGWEPRPADTDVQKALRGTLFGALGVLGGDPDVTALAREIEAESRSEEGADPSLATAAVSVLAATGGMEELASFLAAKDQARTPQEHLRYLMSLVDFRSSEPLSRALELSLTDAVRPQDVPQYLGRSLMNRDGGTLAWSFVRQHWDEVTARLAPSTVIYVAYGARALTAPPVVADVQAFFAEHDIPQSALQLRQILEAQRVNAAFTARATGELGSLFGA
ncbi:MAG TPA: M1 family metallopeptidase [Actinomycetota bacterium]|nr:M1 family metallopeptidase [Actinomycetota bacterium]